MPTAKYFSLEQKWYIQNQNEKEAPDSQPHTENSPICKWGAIENKKHSKKAPFAKLGA